MDEEFHIFKESDVPGMPGRIKPDLWGEQLCKGLWCKVKAVNQCLLNPKLCYPNEHVNSSFPLWKWFKVNSLTKFSGPVVLNSVKIARQYGGIWSQRGERIFVTVQSYRKLGCKEITPLRTKKHLDNAHFPLTQLFTDVPPAVIGLTDWNPGFNQKTNLDQ